MSHDQTPAGDEQGSSWTLWSAAYAYAHAMRAAAETRFVARARGPEFWDVPAMLLTFVIADYADEQGISSTVASPQDLADLSIGTLYDRLHPLKLALALSTLPLSRRAVIPTAGEPAHEQFSLMKAEIDDFNEGGAKAVLADPRRMEKVKNGGSDWHERSEDAQQLIALTLMASVNNDIDLQGDATLSLIADRVPGYRDDTSLAAVLRAARPDAAVAHATDAERGFPAAEQRVKQVVTSREEGWPAAAGRDLLALVLYSAAHERDQTVAEVPWSAVRARTLLDSAELLDYLTGVLAGLGHYTTDPRTEPDIQHAMAALAEDPVAQKLHHLRSRHYFEGWDSSDGTSSDPGYSTETHLEFGMPYAPKMLDPVLLAERGGFAIGSTVSVLRLFSKTPEEGTVRSAVWKTGTPPAGRPGMVDLEPGGPAGYEVRFRYGDDSRVAAEKCSATVPPALRRQP
ncbi:hypothetical protein ABIA39_008982 [Nocardia sp. GAS34]|uniref:hypothetical protein n=1 Tax=unclassified Nocardia TaxID=2637762 RepID=UPI003D1B6771